MEMNARKNDLKALPTILVIDDEPLFLGLLEQSFSLAGIRCMATTEAAKAIEIAKEYSPDLIVSDYQMPNIDGFAFRNMLLSENSLKDIPFAFLTNANDDDTVIQGYELKITDYISKSNSPKIIVAKVAHILNELLKKKSQLVDDFKKATNNDSLETVPNELPPVKGFQLNHWHKPFRDIPGGDFIDFLRIDDEKVIILFGDVMGKKLEAWLYTAILIGYIRSSIRVILKNSLEQKISTSAVLAQINDLITTDERFTDVLVNASMLVLDEKTGIIEYSGGGDLPLLHYLAEKNQIVQISSDGMPLGIPVKNGFNEIAFILPPGDSITLITDGILDSKNIDDAFYGYDNLDNVIIKSAASNNIVDGIRADLFQFANGRFADDITVLSIKRI